MAKATTKTKTSSRTNLAPGSSEIGVSGISQYSGVITEEHNQKLKGTNGIKIYRRMTDEDSVIGALLNAIDLLLRKASMTVIPAGADKATDEAKRDADFVAGVFNDMSMPWDAFISEALTMLSYGWSYFEMVTKRRLGPDEPNSSRRSKYSDGMIGIRKLAPRAQDTLDRWELEPDGGIVGMWQRQQAGSSVLLPITRSLLVRTISRKNNPEGRSILRNAYRPWYYLSNIQDVEAIGIERELAGMPVLRIPAKTLNSEDPKEMAVKAAYEKIARDLKFNQQGALIIPSDTFRDSDGKMSDKYMVDVQLISTNGRRQIDTTAVVLRYQRDIARVALADFIMLGTDGKGSYALSEDKTELFLTACVTYLNQIADPVNRITIPRLWGLNGKPIETMPHIAFGKISPTNLGALSGFIKDLSAAGMAFFPDDPTEKHLRETAGLPSPDPNSKREKVQPQKVTSGPGDKPNADPKGVEK